MPLTVEQLTVVAQRVFGPDRVLLVTAATPLFEYLAMIELAITRPGFEGGIAIADLAMFARHIDVALHAMWVRSKDSRTLELWLQKPLTQEMRPIHPDDITPTHPFAHSLPEDET